MLLQARRQAIRPFGSLSGLAVTAATGWNPERNDGAYGVWQKQAAICYRPEGSHSVHSLHGGGQVAQNSPNSMW